jgi:nucleotidyltransferase substrate binding protein (TIGR01987 family)
MNQQNKDIRWEQRFSNFSKAFGQLLKYKEKQELNEMEKQGLIKAFEFTYELAWNTLKDYLEYQGIQGVVGSRDATRYAFSNELISDGDGWMKMLESRNKTSHTYNEETAEEISRDVLTEFIPLFGELENKLKSLSS